MIKVAVLDDYQDAFRQIIDVEKFQGKFEFKVFAEPFENENEAIIASFSFTKGLTNILNSNLSLYLSTSIIC